MGRLRKQRESTSEPKNGLANEMGSTLDSKIGQTTAKSRGRLNFAAFQDFVATYDNKDSLTFYLYRVWPVIDLKLVGEPYNYIDVLTVAEERLIAQKWGRGTYRLCATDSMRKGDARLVETVFEVTDADLEPRFEHGGRELDLGHPKNGSFVRGLRLAGKLPDGGAPVNDNGGAAGVLAATVRELTKQREPQGLDLKNTLELAREISGSRADPFDLALKINAQRDSGGGAASAAIDKLMAQNERLMGLVLNNAGGGKQQQPDLLAQIETLDRIREKVGGGGGGAAMPAWVEKLFEVAAPLVLGFLARQAAAAPPAAAPAASTPAGHVPAAQQVVDGQKVDEVDGMKQLQKLREVGDKALAAFAAGRLGSQFAEGLVMYEPDGEQIYGFLYQMGAATILATLKGSPQWATLALHEPAVVQWIDDFIAYGAPEDDPPAPPLKAA